MTKVFKVKPKKIKRTNGVIITPEMELIVTMKQHSSTPFSNGAVEYKEALMQKYGVDYKKGCFCPNDFEFEKLD